MAEASATLDDLGSASQRLSNNLDSALEDLGTTREHAQTSLTSLSQALNEGASSIAGIAASGSYDIGAIAGDIGWAQGKLDGALSEIRASLGTLASLKETLQQVRDEIAGVAPETDAAKSAQEDILAMLDDAITSLDAFTQTQTAALDRLQAAADNIAAGAENARGLSSAIAEAASAGAEGLSDLSSALASTTLPELSHALDSFAQAGGSAQTGAASASSMIEQARGTLSSLDAVLEQAGAAVSATAEGLRTSARTLNTVARDLDALSSAWTLQELEELGNIDPDDIASIMAEPVALDAQPVFPVANYGSGVAPFYTNLALWVGGFVLIAIYKLEVDGEGIDSATPRDAFFGRWLLHRDDRHGAGAHLLHGRCAHRRAVRKSARVRGGRHRGIVRLRLDRLLARHRLQTRGQGTWRAPRSAANPRSRRHLSHRDDARLFPGNPPLAPLHLRHRSDARGGRGLLWIHVCRKHRGAPRLSCARSDRRPRPAEPSRELGARSSTGGSPKPISW